VRIEFVRDAVAAGFALAIARLINTASRALRTAAQNAPDIFKWLRLGAPSGLGGEAGLH